MHLALRIVGIIGGIATIGVIVGITGGAPNILAHFAYGPILLAGYAFGPAVGALTGLWAGVSIGPAATFIASGVPGEAELLRRAMEWSILTSWFIAAGLTIGYANQHARERTLALARALGEDPHTGLPDLAATRAHVSRLRAKADSGDASEDALSVSELRIANYEELLRSYGESAVAGMLKELGAEAKRTFGSQTFVSHLRPDTLGIVNGPHAPLSDQQLSDGLETLRRHTLYLNERPAKVDLALHTARGSAAALDSEVPPAAETGHTPTEPVAADTRSSGHNRNGWAASPEHTLFHDEFRRALQNDEIGVHYQPQLDLRSGRIVAAEALARWNHPTRGELPASAFIPSLEESVWLDQLTRHVVTQVLDQLKQWHDAQHKVVVAINLAARSLTDESLLDFTRQAVQTRGLGPGYIDIEITETALLRADASTAKKLESLRQAGFRFTMDHFGMGHASLQHLRTLPIGALKLDEAIVQGLMESSSDYAIAQSVITLAHQLNIKVVAEGVESSQQLKAVKRLACDYAQGFYIAQPMRAERIQTLFSSERWADREDWTASKG